MNPLARRFREDPLNARHANPLALRCRRARCLATSRSSAPARSDPDIGYYLKSALPELAADAGRRRAGARSTRRCKRFADYAQKAVARGKMSADEAAAVMRDVRGSADYDAIAGCDWVIEAATENLALKRRIFAEVEARVAPDAIITSNTSSLPAARIFAEHAPPRARDRDALLRAGLAQSGGRGDRLGRAPDRASSTTCAACSAPPASCRSSPRTRRASCSTASSTTGATRRRCCSTARPPPRSTASPREFVHAGPVLRAEPRARQPDHRRDQHAAGRRGRRALPAGADLPLGRRLGHRARRASASTSRRRPRRRSATACSACCSRRRSTSSTAASAARPTSTSAAGSRSASSAVRSTLMRELGSRGSARASSTASCASGPGMPMPKRARSPSTSASTAPRAGRRRRRRQGDHAAPARGDERAARRDDRRDPRRHPPPRARRRRARLRDRRLRHARVLRRRATSAAFRRCWATRTRRRSTRATARGCSCTSTR